MGRKQAICARREVLLPGELLPERFKCSGRHHVRGGAPLRRAAGRASALPAIMMPCQGVGWDCVVWWKAAGTEMSKRAALWCREWCCASRRPRAPRPSRRRWR